MQESTNRLPGRVDGSSWLPPAAGRGLDDAPVIEASAFVQLPARADARQNGWTLFKYFLLISRYLEQTIHGGWGGGRALYSNGGVSKPLHTSGT